MELIQNAAEFIAGMIIFGIIDFVVVGGALIAYDSHKKYKEDEPDAEAD